VIVGEVEGKGVGLPAVNVGLSVGVEVGVEEGTVVGEKVDFPGK